MTEKRMTPAAIDRAKRRSQALELRAAGRKWREIADALGYSSPQHACRDGRKALNELTEAPAREVLAEELDRLEKLTQAVWKAARGGDVNAIDRVLRIMERRARYLGLDSPEKLEVEATLRSGDEIQSEILEIAEALRSAEG